MLSVVIPCYNEEKYLGACLESLTKQTTKRPFEVIVVDNASTDGTAKIAQSFAARLLLRVLHEPRKGRGPAREAGCRAALGDVIAPREYLAVYSEDERGIEKHRRSRLVKQHNRPDAVREYPVLGEGRDQRTAGFILSLDADVIAPPDWIDTMAAGFSNPEIVGVTGTCFITDQSWLSNAIFNLIQPTVTHLNRLFFGTYWVLGSNGGFRKAAYEKTGGFNMLLNSQEDTQFSLLLARYGRIKYLPESRVLTSGRRFNRGIVLGLLEYVRSFFERFLLRRSNVHLRDAR